MSKDVRESDYAPFLEDLIKMIMEKMPQVIGVVFFDSEGNQYIQKAINIQIITVTRALAKRR